MCKNARKILDKNPSTLRQMQTFTRRKADFENITNHDQYLTWILSAMWWMLLYCRRLCLGCSQCIAVGVLWEAPGPTPITSSGVNQVSKQLDLISVQNFVWPYLNISGQIKSVNFDFNSTLSMTVLYWLKDAKLSLLFPKQIINSFSNKSENDNTIYCHN